MADFKTSTDRWLQGVWYQEFSSGLFLIPLGWLFRLVVTVRRGLYRCGILKSVTVPVPVVVVGNISVGGTGKTPFTIWLVSELRSRGLTPAVISRGFGGQTGDKARRVESPMDPAIFGDEPVLIAQRSGAMVIVGRDRVEAAQLAIECGADIIVADDGLQHYRLARDIEIAMIDAERGQGNGRCLPAGPLREPVSRLRSVDLIVYQNEQPGAVSAGFSFSLGARDIVSIADQKTESLQSWQGRTVRAMAAIANPGRFFRLLQRAGLSVIETPLIDHAGAEIYPLDEVNDTPVVVTEKDAVKLKSRDTTNVWYVPVTAIFEAGVAAEILDHVTDQVNSKSDRT